MKVVKIILLCIVAVIAMALITALFVKKEFTVEREINISKPKAEVFEYLKFLKNQSNFSVWQTQDPQMKKEFRGTDGEVGFVASWDSNNQNVGKGEQEIKKITVGERIDTEIRFIKPFESTDNAYMITEQLSETETRVKWGLNGKMNYPMNLSLMFMNMDKMLGNDLKSGLENLKTLLEKQ